MSSIGGKRFLGRIVKNPELEDIEKQL